jgi:glycine/D-amino acid oxidase-like deaminating enzyme
VAVIGEGMEGSSAALRLAHAGHDVTVLERGAAPGGKMREETPGSGRLTPGRPSSRCAGCWTNCSPKWARNWTPT